MKNTGRPSEDIFDQHWMLLGKRAYVHVFTDSAEVRGMNKKQVMVKAQPADRLVVLDGLMFLAEVKSSVASHDRFDFKLLQAGQSRAAAMVLAAGGEYLIYYHHLSTNEWFRFSYSEVKTAKEAGASSIPLAQLREQRRLWIPSTTL